MIQRVGRIQMIGIAAILVVFFIAEFALLEGPATSRLEQAATDSRG